MRLCLTALAAVYTMCAIAQQISLPAFIAKDIDVIMVTPKGGVLDVGGYDGSGVYVTQLVTMGPTDVLAISKKSWGIYPSLITIPFKARAAVDSLAPTVQLGLANAGIAFNVFDYKLTRYFNSGKQSTHRFGIGLFVAPSAEEISPTTTGNRVATTSKQLFISTGLSLTYTYNDVTFALIPAGLDIATTSEGKRFIHNEKYWWGLGIGITTKLFGIH